MVQVTRLALLALGLAATAPTPLPQVRSPAGSYDLLICRHGCGEGDTARAYIRGILVLTDSVVRQSPSDSLVGGGSGTGCFRLRELRTKRDPIAAPIRVWSRVGRSDSITVAMYHTADARYDLRVSVSEPGLRGVGTYGSATPVGSHMDSVIAIRLGPADTALCR